MKHTFTIAIQIPITRNKRFNFCNFVNMGYRFKMVRGKSIDPTVTQWVLKQTDTITCILERLFLKTTVE